MTLTDTRPAHVADRTHNGHQTPLASARASTMLAGSADAEPAHPMPRDNNQADVAPLSQKPRRRFPQMSAEGWLTVAFIGVLMVGFVMSYHGLYVFGQMVMRWNDQLAAVAPLGVDLLSVLLLIGTLWTRDAETRVRVYMWSTFGGVVGLSIVGNALAEVALATERAGGTGLRFDTSAATIAAVSGAAVWPVMYALGLHTLIVVRRHLDAKRAQAGEVAEQIRRNADVQQALETRALVLAAGGASTIAILAELELPEDKRRTVERWTKPVRDGLAAARAESKPITSRPRKA